VFFDSHSILLRQAPDDGSNTAALARSGKSKSTFNRSGPCHQRCIARAKVEANVCFPPKPAASTLAAAIDQLRTLRAMPCL